MIGINNRHSRMALISTNLFKSLSYRRLSLYYGKIILEGAIFISILQVQSATFSQKMTRSGFTTNDIVAKYKGKKKVEENLPEADDKVTLKRKREDQVTNAEKHTRSEEVLESQAVSIAKLMSKEIRMWKVKCDTLDMDRAEYEKDLKDAFKILREKKLEVRAKDEEILKWRSRLASVDVRHESEMEILRDDMMNETVKAVFETRIQMIKEYREGEHVNWDLDDENAALQRIIDEKVGEVTYKKIEQANDTQDSNTE